MQADYFGVYRHLKLSRDDKGVLVAEFQDRAYKIVIITGAGGNSLGT
jgi:hypothetical protein